MKYALRILLLLALSSTAYADSLLSSSSCIIAGDMGDSIVTVHAVSNSCSKKCNDYCAQIFKVDHESIKANDSIKEDELQEFKRGVISVNKDRIERCLIDCLNNKPTSTKVRVPIRKSSSGQTINDDGKNPKPWLCEIYPQANSRISDLSCSNGASSPTDVKLSTCSTSELAESYAETNVKVEQGTNIEIKIISSNPENPDYTNNDILKYAKFGISLCGNKTEFFSPTYQSFDGPIEGRDGTSIKFDPYSSNDIRTGIKVKDGDYLSVNYYGRYYSQCYGNGNCILNDDDYKIKIAIGNKVLNYRVYPQRSQDKSSYIDDMKQCQNCGSQMNVVCSNPPCRETMELNPVNGLQPRVSWGGNPKIFARKLNRDDSGDSFRSTTLSGTLHDFAQNPSRLSFGYNRHTNMNSPKGGYFVEVNWQGCRYQNGEMLEYAILDNADDTSPLQKNGTWKPVNFLPGKIAQVTADKNGSLFLRIKSLDPERARIENGIYDYSRAYMSGEYHVKIKLKDSNGGNGLNRAINKFLDDFAKDLQNKKENILRGIMQDSSFVLIVRAILVLYIGLTGLFFMAGIARITQQEALLRIFKIAVVLVLISPTSFEILNAYLLDAFSYERLTAWIDAFTPRIIASDDGMLKTNGNNNYTNCLVNPEVRLKALCLMSEDLNIIFSEAFWQRILGLFFSGLFISTIFLIAGILLYTTVIVKIICIFAVGILAMAITVSLAPFFICCILFNETRAFFNAWMKQLIVLILQPTFMFMSVTIFRMIFILLLNLMMGIASCKVCLASFLNWCILKLYVPLGLGSAPTHISSVITNLLILLAIFFVGYSMSSFATFASSMATNLITFTSLNISNARVGARSMLNDMKSTLTLPAELLGIDKRGRNLRK